MNCKSEVAFTLLIKDVTNLLYEAIFELVLAIDSFSSDSSNPSDFKPLISLAISSANSTLAKVEILDSFLSEFSNKISFI